MRLRFSHFAWMLAAVWLTVPGSFAQRPHPQQQQKNRNAAQDEQKSQEDDARALAGLPPKWAEKLQEMPPEDQERFLKNNARFKQLPPQRQAQIRQRLQHWNSLSPEQREAVRDRQRVWEQMSPEQHEYIRNTLLPEWQQLPDERKQMIRDRLHLLHDMNPAERAQKLQDPQFLQGLAPHEQDMLRNMNSLENPAPAGAAAGSLPLGKP
jgi:hypothetical protein